MSPLFCSREAAELGLFTKSPGYSCVTASSSPASWSTQQGSTFLHPQPQKWFSYTYWCKIPPHSLFPACIYSACAPPYCGVLPCSHVGSIYSPGTGWLTRRQFHFTVPGSCLGAFSTLMDKFLLMVLNACQKALAQPNPLVLTCASLSPELHLHEPETGSLNPSGLKISQILFNEVSTTILSLKSDWNTS